tara:strand:- start:178 stop:633 length:456 start_codon:yes stop_codon:yes gene_type:complete
MKLKILASALTLLTISGCSLLQQAPREVQIISKPIEIIITQPIMPRPLNLKEPHWYVVSDTTIANKDGLYPEGYTYFDKFVDDIKKKHGGDLVFIAMSVADYELMSYNTQELKRYISQLGEVIVYYRDVTLPTETEDEKKEPSSEIPETVQ